MVKEYCPYCGKPLYEGCDCEVLAQLDAEQKRQDYLNNPETHRGWAQQDVIDAYRRER